MSRLDQPHLRGGGRPVPARTASLRVAVGRRPASRPTCAPSAGSPARSATRPGRSPRPATPTRAVGPDHCERPALQLRRRTAGRAQPVEWQTAIPAPVTAVSVAPDGHRVAMVAGGRLYRAVLTVGGDGVALATPDQIWPAARAWARCPRSPGAARASWRWPGCGDRQPGRGHGRVDRRRAVRHAAGRHRRRAGDLPDRVPGQPGRHRPRITCQRRVVRGGRRRLGRARRAACKITAGAAGRPARRARPPGRLRPRRSS